MTMNAVEAALKHVERNERNHRVAILAGAVLEAVFLGTFLLVADFSNRTHVLLLMLFAASLSLLVIAGMALGAFVNRHTLRVLTAVEMLRGELATSTSAPSHRNELDGGGARGHGRRRPLRRLAIRRDRNPGGRRTADPVVVPLLVVHGEHVDRRRDVLERRPSRRSWSRTAPGRAAGCRW